MSVVCISHQYPKASRCVIQITLSLSERSSGMAAGQVVRSSCAPGIGLHFEIQYMNSMYLILA